MTSMKSNIAIVASDYYEDICEGLINGFTKSLDSNFSTDIFKLKGA